ncbi:DUF924 family protein [Sneathiella litorea]|uniref:DUF924 family protein n=1 Tax=Sneathiella litorea TaxID=2606216 RepID=A0A6L8W876_9PROT|nr:DUF924 family protein [Sneathiella litorea]MZR31298.1 DUF924 family protein [Sneathiella litorea]
MDRIQEILDFWFLPESNENYGKRRDVWFKKDDEFDASIRSQFLEDFEKAEAGDYLDWTESARGSLALILLYDQFTRNMFRDTARAFSADGKAREIARHILSQGFYDELSPVQKQFAALPFEHSEDLEDQKLSLQLFQELESDVLVEYAQRHYDIIEKFGRFPHRNKQLNRQSTNEEEAFLTEPNSSF